MQESYFNMKNLIKIFIISIFVNISLFAAFPQQKVLSPNEAFQVSSSKTSNGIIIKIKLGDKMYVYDDKLHVELISPKKVLLDKETIRPKPVSFHGFIVHRKNIEITIPNKVINKYVNGGKYTIKVSYQGCSELGLCYQPMSNEFTFTSEKALNNTTKTKSNSISSLSEEDKIVSTIKNSSFFIVLLTFFGFGLLLSLTPCVFPMIPILSSVIVSQSNKNMNTKKAFFLSLVYVLSMSLAYAMAGIMAGLFGENIQTALQNPWVISIFSLIFILLSFSMFGFYELQMPSFIQSKLSKKSGNTKKGGVLSIAVMGFLSALIVGPCVAAPLAGALVYIGQSGDALLGGLSLFVMSLGMGVPLLIIGAGAGRFMPRPGEWMEKVKAIFGVLMLGVAIWMMSRIISPVASMLLWMALILISSVYMGALESLRKNSSGWKKLFKGIGIIFFIYAIMLFIGAMRGVTNPINPLELNTVTKSQNKIQNNKLIFKRIKTLNELNKEIKNSTKPVMIDFYADWCVSCKELDEYTFKNTSVEKRMAKFNLIQIDVTKNNANDKVLLKRFNVFGPPSIIFFKDNKELKSLKIVGYKDAQDFAKHLDKVLNYK